MLSHKKLTEWDIEFLSRTGNDYQVVWGPWQQFAIWTSIPLSILPKKQSFEICTSQCYVVAKCIRLEILHEEKLEYLFLFLPLFPSLFAIFISEWLTSTSIYLLWNDDMNIVSYLTVLRCAVIFCVLLCCAVKPSAVWLGWKSRYLY